jgi:hypothetical protein
MQDGGLKSYRCLGETRNGRQCSQRCVSQAGEDFSFCAEHVNQRSLRLSDFRAQSAQEGQAYVWRQLGIGGAFEEPEKEEPERGGQQEREKEKKRRQDRNLRDLADDDENIHTIEIQRPLVQAISMLRTWAESPTKKVKIEDNLGKTIYEFLAAQKIKNEKVNVVELKPPLPPVKKFTETVVNEFWRGSMKTVATFIDKEKEKEKQKEKKKDKKEKEKERGQEYIPSKTEKDCLDHLNRVYSIDDKESVLGITFPILSSWVWQRVVQTQDLERRSELVKRFVEEMAESKGLCLQGNITRLMNVFSGLDAEVSLQDVDLFDTGPISDSYMQQQTAAAVTRFGKKLISYEELIATVHVLMKRANASKEVLEDWLAAIDDLVTVRPEDAT